jgi:hypothetical protein
MCWHPEIQLMAPLGQPSGASPVHEVAATVERNGPGWLDDLVLVPRPGGLVVAVNLWCAAPEHGARIAELNLAVNVRQLGRARRVCAAHDATWLYGDARPDAAR